MVWEEIQVGNVIRFEEKNQVITGVLKAIREGTYENSVYDIETKEGLVTIFGTVILDNRMSKIKPEEKIRITYLGEIKTGSGRIAKNFKVEIDK